MDSFRLLSEQLLPADLDSLKFEMDLARRVQFSLFPKIPPVIPGLDLAGFFRPASHVGGDFYDFIAGPDHSLTFFVGDVSGKGIAAAMFMTVVRAILRAEIKSAAITPEVILQNVNDKLLADFIQAGLFVTVFVGQYYPDSREMVFANAGHSPIVFRPANGKPRLLQADGTPLGISETSIAKNYHICLADGDLLVAMTDGFSDARSSRGECYGIHRLLKQVQRFNSQSAMEISNNLLSTVEHFRDHEPQADDQTVLVLQCTGQQTR